MKISTDKYNVAVNGTRKVVCYYGFKTRKEAEEMAAKFSEVTGKEFEVIRWGKWYDTRRKI